MEPDYYGFDNVISHNNNNNNNNNTVTCQSHYKSALSTAPVLNKTEKNNEFFVC